MFPLSQLIFLRIGKNLNFLRNARKELPHRNANLEELPHRNANLDKAPHFHEATGHFDSCV